MGGGGKSSEAQDHAHEDLRGVPFYSEFLRDDFTSSGFASQALTASTATAQAQIEQLEVAIRTLKEKLSTEVNSRQEELLEQASSLRDAEGAVQGINVAADSLFAALKRVTDEVMQPYREIELKTLQLRNLQASTDLLRHVLQSIKLTQRLRTHIKAPPTGTNVEGVQQLGDLNLAKAAKLLTDVASVNEEADLSGVDVITAEQGFLEATSTAVRHQAQVSLDKGMEALSQAEVGSALQIFFNLQDLPRATDSLVEQHLRGLERALQTALDARKLAGEAGGSGGLLGPASTRSGAASARVQEVLWQQLTSFASQVRVSAVAVWHLQRVLAKKRDPLTHVCFIHTFSQHSTDLPLTKFWSQLTASLKSQLEAAVGKGGVVREALVHSFPRLASLLEDNLSKLQQETNVRGVDPALSKEWEEGVVAALAPCQALYLGAVFGRVSDAISAAFPGGTRALPSSADLQKCIGRIHEELKGVGQMPRLAALIAHTVGKALRILAEKAEFMAVTGAEIRNVGGACTSQQLRRITLCNHLHEVSRSVATFLTRLPQQAAANLRGPLEVLEAGAIEAILPLIRAIVDRGEHILLKMHEQGYDQEEAPAVIRASAYMQDFIQHISHCRLEFLSKLVPTATPQNSSSVGSALVQRFASRMLVFFLRHASLLRPVTQAGKLQLAKDMGELEEAVGANLWPLDKLPHPQRMLRSFRRLIFSANEDLEQSPVLKELPVLLVLQHLYSRLPPAIPSPHTRSGFTPQQYSLWLDEHSVAEGLGYIRSALEACSAEAESSDGRELYSLMLQLCSP